MYVIANNIRCILPFPFIFVHPLAKITWKKPLAVRRTLNKNHITHKSDIADLQIHEKKKTVMVNLLHALYEIFV